MHKMGMFETSSTTFLLQEAGRTAEQSSATTLTPSPGRIGGSCGGRGVITQSVSCPQASSTHATALTEILPADPLVQMVITNYPKIIQKNIFFSGI